MGSTPTSTNSEASGVNKGINVAGNAIVAMVEAMILADVPQLNLPIVKQLWEALFEWVAGYFIKAAATGATFAVIDSQVSSEQTALTKALEELKAAQKLGDLDGIKKAIQNYADAHSALVHSDGSAHSPS